MSEFVCRNLQEFKWLLDYCIQAFKTKPKAALFSKKLSAIFRTSFATFSQIETLNLNFTEICVSAAVPIQLSAVILVINYVCQCSSMSLLIVT